MAGSGPLTTPLIWQGGTPPDWLGALGLGDIDDPGAVFALQGEPEAVAKIRARRPDALLIAVVDQRTAAVEAALLEAGASLVVDGSDPRLDRLRIQALGRPRRRARTRLRALELSVGLMQAASDEQEFLERLVEVVSRELSSQRVSIMQLDAERRHLVMRAARGIPPEVMATARTRVGEGIAGVSAQLGEPIYVDDHAHIRAGGVSAFELARAAPGTPVSLTVPIRAHGEVVGVINITDRRDGKPYRPQDIDFIDALTRQAGILLENARLMSGLSRLTAFNESLIDTMEDPLAVVDPDGRLAAANRRFSRRFGAGPGDRLLPALPLDDGQTARLSRLLAGEPVPAEALAAWPLGAQIYDLSAQPFESEGRPLTLLMLRDVTAKVDRERRLLSAEKMASLGVLASGIAHEINNPVAYAKANTRTLTEYATDLIAVLDAWRAAARTGETGPAQVLETEVDLPSIQGDLQQVAGEILEGIERVERIVKSLKSFAHPDTEQTQASDLNTLLRSAVLLTTGQWKHTLSVETDFAEGLPSLACLPTQLEQVFMNLVVNAAQAASEAPGHRLTIRTACTPAGLEAVFEDDCGGIPAELRERIFEPFFTTKEIGVGSGLGLAISRNIIAAHGGHLDLEVREGQGTTFRIRLPLGEAGRPLVVKQLSRYRA